MDIKELRREFDKFGLYIVHFDEDEYIICEYGVKNDEIKTIYNKEQLIETLQDLKDDNDEFDGWIHCTLEDDLKILEEDDDNDGK